jgi:hypothetical protein
MRAPQPPRELHVSLLKALRGKRFQRALCFDHLSAESGNPRFEGLERPDRRRYAR